MLRILLTVVVSSVLFLSNGCAKPYQEKVYVDIEPNETAFVIPLQGATEEKQGKFDSESFLESKNVAAKRIYVPTQWHKKGRGWWRGRYIETVKVIRVDRSPVTREWTKEKERGSTSSDDAFRIESKESIEWYQGVTASASIAEEHTAKFLYHYSGKTLEYILDNNVRSFALDYLTASFSKFFLDDARKRKKEVFDSLKIACKAKFLEKGITIENIGAAGGFNYVDDDIHSFG